MWECIKRVIKPKGAVVLFGSQPFTSALVMSNMAQLKHMWVWNKSQSGSYQNAAYGPLRVTEDVCVFSSGTAKYYPQMRKGVFRKKGGKYRKPESEVVIGLGRDYTVYNNDYFPTNILNFPAVRDGLHPSQKPVDLMAYLVETYTSKGETVLDFTFGSGQTGIACAETDRRFVGIELDPHYFTVASERIEAAYRKAQGMPRLGKVSDTDNLPLFAA